MALSHVDSSLREEIPLPMGNVEWTLLLQLFCFFFFYSSYVSAFTNFVQPSDCELPLPSRHKLALH